MQPPSPPAQAPTQERAPEGATRTSPAPDPFDSRGPLASVARGPRWLLAGLLAAAVALTYRNVLGAGLVYDDLLLIGRNAHIRGFGNLLAAFFEPFWAFDDPEPGQTVGFWRPLTMLTLAFGRWLGGGSATPLHALSIGLHLGASLLVWRLAARLTGRFWIAYLASLAFALHPVHVESVAWISAINDPLYSLFALLSLDAFVRWRDGGSRGRPVASGCWLGLALLAKEQALAVLPIAWTVDLMLVPRDPGPGRGWLRAYGPMLAATALYVVARAFVFESPLAGFDRQSAGFGLGWARAMSYRLELFGGFLGLLAWPADLAVFRQVRPGLPEGDPTLLIAAGASGLWLVWLVIAWRRGDRVTTGSLLFLLAAMLPVLVAFESAGAFPFSDRYLYLAVLGWTVLLTHAVLRPLGPKLGTALAVVIFAGYSARATAHTRVFEDDETFFRAAVEASPRTPYVHWGLGRVLLTRYQTELDKPLLDEALLHFLTSLYLGTDYGDNQPRLGSDAPLRDRVSELNAIVNDTPPNERKPDPTVMWSVSDREQANIGIGWCYLFLARLPGDGDLATPLYVFEQTAKLFPESYRALIGLGAVHLERGEVDEALEALRRALEIHPGAPEGWHNLGRAHIRREAWDEARKAFEKALEFRPGEPKDLVGIATTAIEAGRFELAEETLEELREVDPEGLEPLFWSGMLAARQRDFPRALNWFDAVVGREPGHGHAHLERGKLLLQMNETTEAIKALGRACELIPDSFEAHYNLGVLQLERVGPEPAIDYLVRAFELSPRGELRDALHYNLREILRGDGARASYLARICQGRDEPGKAHDWITDAIAAGEPWASDAGAHHRRGWALSRLGQREEAVGAFKRSLELDAERFATNHDLGMLLVSMGRRPEALPYLKAAQRLADQLEGTDARLRAAALEAIGRAIDGTLDFSGPVQLPIPAQDIDERYR